jgi:ABC-type molybdenum transport system ATPase subunit/photorepair protein PhrA
MNDQPIISLRNITVRRAGRPILDSIDLDIREGEHVAIMGRTARESRLWSRS